MTKLKSIEASSKTNQEGYRYVTKTLLGKLDLVWEKDINYDYEMD